MLATIALIALASTSATDVVIRWDAPGECPQRGEMERRLGEERFGRPDAGVVVAAVVSRDAGGYRLRGDVSVRGRTQRIKLSHGESCEALVDKFIIYMFPLLPDVDAVPRAGERRFGGYLRGAVEGDIGGLWNCRDGVCSELYPTLGGVFVGGWIRRGLRVELGVPLHTRDSTVPASIDFGEVTTRWFRTGLRLRVCGALVHSRFEFLLCGELGMQVLVGVPRSREPIFVPSTPVLPWASVRLGLAAVWWMRPRLGLRLDVAPGLYLHPKTYQVFDHLAENEKIRRPLAEVGLPHVVLALGLDLRLGRAK